MPEDITIACPGASTFLAESMELSCTTLSCAALIGTTTDDVCITLGAFTTSGIAFAVIEAPGEVNDSGALDAILVPS
jgi:hypothetical protein